MEYHPRGNVKTILDGMATNDHNSEWTTEEIAQLAGIQVTSVSATMKTALREGLVFKQKRGVSTFWSLTSYEEQAEPVPFNAWMSIEGEVLIHGAQIDENNGVTLTADQLAKLKKLVAWSPAQ